MKILAIDPGNKQSAYVVLEERRVDVARIGARGILPNETVLDIISRSVNAVDDEGCHDIDAVVIEMIQCFGMAVGAEVFETVFWIGRFFEASPVHAHRVNRMEVKMHLCGHPRAKDPNIRQALIDKLGAPGKKSQPGPTFGISADMWAALGVGVTWLETKSKAVA